MSDVRQFVRYVGGGIALLGLVTSAAFIGRRTRDPIVATFIGELGIIEQVLGIVAGLVLMAVGLAVVGRAAPQE